MTKPCKRCNELKALVEFYKDSSMKDNHINICKSCKQEELREYRRKYPERIKNTLDKYRNANKEFLIERAKLSRERNKEKINVRGKEYAKSNPEKRKAYSTFWTALIKGDIEKQPCNICGGDKVHGHHEDYNKPLEVDWLCSQHHIELHQGG